MYRNLQSILPNRNRSMARTKSAAKHQSAAHCLKTSSPDFLRQAGDESFFFLVSHQLNHKSVTSNGSLCPCGADLRLTMNAAARVRSAAVTAAMAKTETPVLSFSSGVSIAP